MMECKAGQFGLKEKLMESIINCAKKNQIERLYIFGSRSRGNYRERSDIDLAAYGGNPSELLADLEEKTPTLLFFDLVDLNRSISDELREELERDAMLIYEK